MTSERIRRAEIEIARLRLKEGTFASNAEVLAVHYASLAQTALDLLELVRMARYAGGHNSTSLQCAEELVKQIRTAQERDLGIEMERFEDSTLSA